MIPSNSVIKGICILSQDNNFNQNVMPIKVKKLGWQCSSLANMRNKITPQKINYNIRVMDGREGQ